jgi:hypothetical protein
VTRFAGIDTFAPDLAWVVTAEFRPVELAHTEHIVHSNSDREVDYRVVGTFAFTAAGHSVELVGLDTGHAGEAHITFRDATSGKQTYAAARFLFVPLPTEAGPVTLDRTTAPMRLLRPLHLPTPAPPEHPPVPRRSRRTTGTRPRLTSAGGRRGPGPAASAATDRRCGRLTLQVLTSNSMCVHAWICTS